MRISIKRRIGRYKLSLVFGTVKAVQGIDSNLPGNYHILMWDFDEPDSAKIENTLRKVQEKYRLPEIILARSSDGGGIHAYCFCRTTWIHSLIIIASTPLVDTKWVSLCCMRGHWTLRLSDKGKGRPSYLNTLPSDIMPSASSVELISGVSYEVWDKAP